MSTPFLGAWKHMALVILVIGLFSPAGLASTPYTAASKGVANRILDNRAGLKNLDEEYTGLQQELAKIVVLNFTKSKDIEGYDDNIQIAKEIDPLIKEYHAIENQDLGAAAELLGKQTITVLINFLELTQPQAATALEATKAGVEAAIVLAKMRVNRNAASGVSANISADLDAMSRLIAKDKAYREAQAKNTRESSTIRLDDPVIKDLEDALANFQIHLDPIPETQQHPEGTSDGVDLDKALNQLITREIGPENPYLPDLLIPTANSGASPPNYIYPSGPCTLEQWKSGGGGGLTETANPDETSLSEIIERARQKSDSLRSEQGRLKTTIAEYDEKIREFEARSQSLMNLLDQDSHIVYNGMYHSQDGEQTWLQNADHSSYSIWEDPSLWSGVSDLFNMLAKISQPSSISRQTIPASKPTTSTLPGDLSFRPTIPANPPRTATLPGIADKPPPDYLVASATPNG